MIATTSATAVRDGRTKIIPEEWTKTYEHWMTNILDWCISRQLWWGHRIPAWYDAEGNVYVARNHDEALALYDERLPDRGLAGDIRPFFPVARLINAVMSVRVEIHVEQRLPTDLDESRTFRTLGDDGLRQHLVRT